MRTFELPAGWGIRLTVSSRAGSAGLHHWGVRVTNAGDAGAPRLESVAYGSRIGGEDREQRISIAPQAAASEVEVWSRHGNAAGWDDDRSQIQVDTPDRLDIAFHDPNGAGARSDDLVLSFAFSPPSH